MNNARNLFWGYKVANISFDINIVITPTTSSGFITDNSIALIRNCNVWHILTITSQMVADSFQLTCCWFDRFVSISISKQHVFSLWHHFCLRNRSYLTVDSNVARFALCDDVTVGTRDCPFTTAAHFCSLAFEIHEMKYLYKVPMKAD